MLFDQYAWTVPADSTAVLVPLRSMRDGKRRLTSVLDERSRAELIATMAARVIAAAHDLDVFVVHDEDDVAMWAATHGALAIRPEVPGLNEAVTYGCDHLRTRGYRRAIIAHADLPLAEDLRVVITESPVAIVTDRYRDLSLIHI